MQQTRLIVHMAVLDGTEAVIVEKVVTPGMLVVPTWIGRRLDVNSTGVGKALVAYISDNELEMIAKAKGFPRRNDNTITSLSALKQELARVRAMGYSLDNEEDEIGERCIGVPVFDPDSSIVAAISLAGTINQIPDERVHEMADLLKRTAAQIASRLHSHKKQTADQNNDAEGPS
jgi:DNA-binding IclR family transcriptional regulator